MDQDRNTEATYVYLEFGISGEWKQQVFNDHLFLLAEANLVSVSGEK